MAFCNIMTGSGFDVSMFGGLSMAWLGACLLFFVVVFAHKYLGGDGAGLPFSRIGAFIGAYLPYLVVVTITCSYKFALGAGILGAGIVGIAFAGLFPDGEG